MILTLATASRWDLQSFLENLPISVLLQKLPNWEDLNEAQESLLSSENDLELSNK